MKLLKVIKQIDKKDKSKIKIAFTERQLIDKLKIAKNNDIIIYDEQFENVDWITK
jgi:hypothetical protein